MSNRLLCTLRSSALALLAVGAICTGPASAQQVKVGDLVLDHAWARATPGGAKVGGGYLTIENKGTTPDKLIGGSSPAAGKVEVHEMAMNNDVMTMRRSKADYQSTRPIRHAHARWLSHHADGIESSAEKGRQGAGDALI